MLRRSLWVSAMMLSGSGLLMMSGCAEQGPKPGGVTTVSPASKPGTTPAAPTDDQAKTEGDKAQTEKTPAATETPPAGADVPSTSTDTRTTGGGTETPSTPGNGQ